MCTNTWCIGRCKRLREMRLAPRHFVVLRKSQAQSNGKVGFMKGLRPTNGRELGVDKWLSPFVRMQRGDGRPIARTTTNTVPWSGLVLWWDQPLVLSSWRLPQQPNSIWQRWQSTTTDITDVHQAIERINARYCKIEELNRRRVQETKIEEVLSRLETVSNELRKEVEHTRQSTSYSFGGRSWKRHRK